MRANPAVATELEKLIDVIYNLEDTEIFVEPFEYDMLDGFSVVKQDNRKTIIYGHGSTYSVEEAIELGILTQVQGGFGDIVTNSADIENT